MTKEIIGTVCKYCGKVVDFDGNFLFKVESMYQAERQGYKRGFCSKECQEIFEFTSRSGVFNFEKGCIDGN